MGMTTFDNDMAVIDRAADEIHRKAVKAGTYTCTCGGPQYGTDHAPDCDIVLGWDESRQEAEDEWYEANLPDEPDDTPYCNLEEYGAHD